MAGRARALGGIPSPGCLGAPTQAASRSQGGALGNACRIGYDVRVYRYGWYTRLEEEGAS